MSFFTIDKGVVERFSDSLFDFAFAKQWHRVPQPKRKQSQVVQAKQMVGMFVRVQNRMHNPDLFSQQLCAKIRWRIDQQQSAGQVQQHGTAQTFVARIIT